MDAEIIYFYYVADDFFKVNYLKKDSQNHMSNTKIVTVALTAATFFGEYRK